MKRDLLLLAVTLVVSALVLEAGLRAFYEIPPTLVEPQLQYDRSPLLGWVLPVNDESYTIDAVVRTNSLGLRDDEISRSKPDGEIRVLALGDSFTFALGVRFEDLWVQQLEAALNERWGTGRVQVINAAVAGYNTRQELLYLRAEGLGLDPDLIIVGFFWNDLIGNGSPLPDLDTTPLRSAQTWDKASPPSHTLPPWIRDNLRRSLSLYLGVTGPKSSWARLQPTTSVLHRVQAALLQGDQAVLEPYWKATAERLLQISEAAQERAIPVLLVIFPMENQIRFDFPDLVVATRLEQIWQGNGMLLLDLEPPYREALARGANLFLPYNLHPGPEGMRVAADAIYRTLISERMLPPVPRAALR